MEQTTEVQIKNAAGNSVIPAAFGSSIVRIGATAASGVSHCFQ